ncbi:MAG: lytic transglycosylase domain-containing protein [Selenomonadaceae bacterium]|nr:lytic transglycosylase domain-containing protein [Selenomonadaceae bacterium]
MINPVDMSSIANVKERISAIQERMGLGPNVPGMDFDRTLRKELNKLKGTAEAVATVPGAIRDTVAEAKKNVEASLKNDATTLKNTAKGILSAHENTASGTLQSFMEDAAKKYNIDQRLLKAVAEVESGLNPDAISEAGAIGVMQLMPETAAALGVNPNNVAENIEGGAKYLRQMLDTFGGDVKKALAAYNAGPNAVRSYNGVPPYTETQNYVNSVLDIYR